MDEKQLNLNDAVLRTYVEGKKDSCRAGVLSNYYRDYLNPKRAENDISANEVMFLTLQDISITLAMIYDELREKNE